MKIFFRLVGISIKRNNLIHLSPETTTTEMTTTAMLTTTEEAPTTPPSTTQDISTLDTDMSTADEALNTSGLVRLQGTDITPTNYSSNKSMTNTTDETTDHTTDWTIEMTTMDMFMTTPEPFIPLIARCVVNEDCASCLKPLAPSIGDNRF